MKGRPVFLRLEQVLADGFAVAPEQVFQFLEILRPAEAVEKFRAGKLRLIQRVLLIAGAQIQVFYPAPGE
jgi:hypothetical protein